MRTFSRAVLAALAVLIFTPIFVSPSFADVAAGDVLVADLGTCRDEQHCDAGTGSIRRYSASGVEAPAFVSGLSAPWSITADQLGNIYVSERDGQKVKKFSPSGGDPLLTITTAFTPGGVRVADGTIYVVDSSGGKINRYSASDGTDLGSFASTGLVSADFMAFDAGGNLYVTGADSVNVNNEVVRRFSPAGADDFVAGFFAPAGIMFDAQGNLYVASSTSHIVEQYSSSKTDLGTFAFGDPTGGDAFRGIAFDASGNLYVANSAAHNILRFPPAVGVAPEFFATGLGFPWDLVIVPMPANPTVKPECKEDGWQSFDFKNQGDCIQFVNTGK